MPTYIIGAKLVRPHEQFRQHAEAAAQIRQRHGAT
jgi:hypothetical protein